MNKINLSIIGLLTLLIITSCKEKKEVKEETKKFVLSDTMAKMIAIDTVSSGFINDTVTLTGEVSFNENTVNKIFPRNSGQVIDCKISIGDKVHAGQVLATIKSADIAGSYSDLASSNADLAIAKRQLTNIESLYKNGIASEKEYTEAKQNYEKALAAKRKIESLININGGSQTNAGGTYVLTSPIDGYVVEKKVNTGNFIRPDMGDNLFTISDLKDVWINANVFEADITRVKEGYAVEVTTLAYPDKIFKGKIDKIGEVLDPTSKALRARIKLPNEGMLLKPEMFAKVIVNNEEKKKAIYIPTKALISQNSKNYVIVYNGKDDMKIAEVNILKTVGDKTYLVSGVTPGQQLITQNQLLIFQQLLNN
ncbi:MAG: efflux RND transporter periplasmic adaptor subunit [Bacteroidota bacterium]|nr:efflux RND transporter periplasmic adaptor subunit [Bacteroidota bacterium]